MKGGLAHSALVTNTRIIKNNLTLSLFCFVCFSSCGRVQGFLAHVEGKEGISRWYFAFKIQTGSTHIERRISHQGDHKDQCWPYCDLSNRRLHCCLWSCPRASQMSVLRSIFVNGQMVKGWEWGVGAQDKGKLALDIHVSSWRQVLLIVCKQGRHPGFTGSYLEGFGQEIHPPVLICSSIRWR